MDNTELKQEQELIDEKRSKDTEDFVKAFHEFADRQEQKNRDKIENFFKRVRSNDSVRTEQ
jgi:hypothetical protein